MINETLKQMNIDCPGPIIDSWASC